MSTKNTAAKDGLLLKFRLRDTKFGVTRETVKALAHALDVSETRAIHMALAQFAAHVLPAYEVMDDEFPGNQMNN